MAEIMEMTHAGKNPEIIEKLFKAGAHFGYTKSRRHPSTKPFIFGIKNKIEIFDLEKTSESLDRAKEFVRKLASERKQLLFVSGKNEAKEIVQNAAQSIGQPYVAGRWIGGSLTNFQEIKKRIDKLVGWTDSREKGEFGKYTKKERLLIDREIENLKEMFSGLIPMKDIPGALFVVDSRREHIAVEEAHGKGLPVVSLSGSDCDLSKVDYPVPGNDSSVASITFFVNEIAEAYREGSKIVA
ncbi:30S ribosomal protein S2 [Candidatus Parcubacteria bacterium]|nr:30S ribosomal protein S2 [Candidatus Parcubacteria bacterium]